MNPLRLDGHEDTLELLEQWRTQGMVHSLDVAFARFLHTLCPEASPLVLLAAAFLAYLEGRGHSCLHLDPSTPGWGLSPELHRALQAHLPPTLLQRDTWIAALRSCPGIYQEGTDADVGQPLVLKGDRLYLRRYWQFEQRVARQVVQRTRTPVAMPMAARDWLDRLFPPATPAGLDWQKIACAISLTGQLSVITGGPGTGKTYTVARLLALLLALAPDPHRLRIALAAPTGKAATRLKQSLDEALESLAAPLANRLPLRALAERIPAARTLHALLGARPDTRRLRHDAAHPLDVDVLIVDEASMVHLEMMAALLDAVPAHARVVLLGDKDQLASVEAGAVLGDLCVDAGAGGYRPETCLAIQQATGIRIPDAYRHPHGPDLAQHTVMLRKSRRFGGRIGRVARAVNAGRAAAAAKRLRWGTHEKVLWIEQASPEYVVTLAVQGRRHAPDGYAEYLHRIQDRPTGEESHNAWVQSVLESLDRFRVLCAVREGPWGVVSLNQKIEKQLEALGLISVTGEWYVGRPVMVTRNDHELGVFNGDMGVALKASPRSASLRVYFLNGDQLRSVSVSRLTEVETAYAMTIHKSQGSEFAHTVVALPAEGGGMTRELIYTGITRAKESLTLVTERQEALQEGIERRTQRNSGLLDWIGEVGRERGATRAYA